MDFQPRWEALQREGPLAVAEVLLFFVVLFSLMKFLRGSRGAAVLRGTLFLIGVMIATVFLAASLLALEHIAWAFEKLAALFMVALLVIFQPELRKGLLRLGMTPIFRRLVRASSPAIDELVEAAGIMSGQKVGAIIAIERQVPLTSFAESGTLVGAEISAGLIRTIFHRDTVLHDGAVIVRGNRIAAAGCILPLTESEVSRALGTRHRAALGLSEESDAVTIVVSEETGQISLGVDGKLKQGLTPDALRKELVRLCLESVEEGS